MPVRNYLYDGDSLYGDYGSWTNPPSYLYVHGPNTDEPLIRLPDGFATPYFYHQDGLGSVVALTVPTGIFQTQLFDAWGSRVTSGGAIPQYGYTGREPDENGLIYYRARHYDPTIGRFLQRDPIGFEGGLNMYAYVSNNPVNKIDPSGNVDIIYSAGSLTPTIENSPLMGFNYFVAASSGTIFPMGAGIFERTVQNGLPIGSVFDANQTSALMDWGVSHIQSNRAFWASPGSDVSALETLSQYLPKRPWDTKQYLPYTSAYIINGKAELRDYVRNAIWGAGVKSLGKGLDAALNEASVQGRFSGIGKEDSRDQEAIRFGYSWPSSSSRSSPYGDWNSSKNYFPLSESYSCRGANCGGPPSVGQMKFPGW